MTLFLLTPFPHHRDAFTYKKVSTVTAACITPPHHLKNRRRRGRPQVNSFVHQPLHSQKVYQDVPYEYLLTIHGYDPK